MAQYRKTPRASWIPYNEGLYFITICTEGKRHFFGEIHNGQMNLSQIGLFVDNELKNPQIHNKHIKIPMYVVMPNHIHAIIEVESLDSDYYENTTALSAEIRTPNPAQRCNPDMPRHVPALSRYINMFKGAVSRYAGRNKLVFQWQSRYHDHLIRGASDGNKIADYIENNIARWNKDCYNDK